MALSPAKAVRHTSAGNARLALQRRVNNRHARLQNNTKYISMEIQGRIIAVLEKRSGVAKSTGNPWATQDYVLETHEQYPHRMVFNVFGEDKISQYNLQVGEEVNVSFDINAREFNGRWYNDIRAWNVVRAQPVDPAVGIMPPAGAPFPPPQAAAPAAPAAAPQDPFGSAPDSNSDLPF